ncbi:MAG: hypothetical protein KC731_30260, partial [Myxococcales bacterium]|nr:hypothetical protein [Myxococcales bacterium]
MKPHLVLLLAAVAIGCSAPAPPSATSIAPSATPSTVPSATPAPSYAYLEDVTSERTQAFVAEKNDAARRYLGALPSRPTFHAGLDRSLRVVELGVPHKARDGYHYYTRKLADRDHPILVRARVYAIERGEEVVLDPNQWSSDGKKKLSGWRLSPDEKRLAYGTSEGGSDWTTWRVLDLSQMKPLADELRGLKWSSPTWTPDGGGLLYSGYENRSHEETAPGDNNRVYHHRLGQPQSADRAVFRPADPEWMVAPYVPP